MKIKTRLRLNTVISLCTVLAILLAISWSARNFQSLSQELELVNEMRKVAFERIVLRDEYLLFHENRAKMQWYAKTEAFRSLLALAETRLTHEKEKNLLKEAHTDFDFTRDGFSKLLEARTRQKLGLAADPTIIDAELRLISQVFLKAYSLNDTINRLHESIHEKSITAQSRGTFWVIFFIFGGAVAIIINSIITNKTVEERLVVLGKGVELMGAGNLAHRIPVENDDELSALAVASNTMAEKLVESHTSVVNLQREIDERNQISGELRLSEAKYRLLFENMTVGFALHEMIYDEQGHPKDYRFLEVNPAFEKLTSQSAAAVIGRTVKEVFPATEEYWIEIYDRVARTGEAMSFHNYSQQLGKHFDIWTFSPSHGQFAAIFSDITERKRSEEETKLHESRLQSIVNILQHQATSLQDFLDYTLDEGIRLTSSKLGYIYYYNEKTEEFVLNSWSKEVMTECAIVEKQTVYQLDKTGLWGEAVRQRKAIMVNDFTAKHPHKKGYPEGHAQLYKYLSLPVFNNNQIVAVIGVANKESNYTQTDILQLTLLMNAAWKVVEKKKAEEELQQNIDELKRSNEELQQFAYVASHDLQEPLRMISSYTQLLAERYENQLDEKANKFIHYAVNGAVRMQLLINDLLAYSRIGSREKQIGPTDTHAVLGRAISNQKMLIDETQALITNDQLPEVQADSSQLLQLFQNLISNALKFHGENPPRIHISAKDEGKEWLFSVSDNGIGIDSQYTDKIFVIFQRLHTKEEYPGSGIGLAICKKIVERHGGKIWFESELGKGTTFYFTIQK